MDLKSEDSSSGIKFTMLGKIIISSSIVITIISAFIFPLEIFGLVSSIILVAIGITVTDSWNKELQEDGYASLSQLYTFYLSSLFLFISIFPIANLQFSLRFAIPISIVVILVYIFILNFMAFRNINSENHEFAMETHGPSVVYIKDGPYMKHIEEIARNEDKSLEEL